MTAEPRNNAADRLREELPRWFDKEYVATQGRSRLADDFVHEDRRPIVGVPPLGADAYIEAVLSLPYRSRDWIEKVLEVRGERLVLCVRGQTQNDDWTSYRLAVFQLDAEVERTERVINFDIDDLDLATAELNRLDAQINEASE